MCAHIKSMQDLKELIEKEQLTDCSLSPTPLVTAAVPFPKVSVLTYRAV